jgi:pimeloyl-ACP methyl ester carboxylesterase
VIAAQYGLDTLEGDVATVKRTLGRVSSLAILVGHSYGGTVITAAGTDDRVAGLVYIAALAPDANETSQRQQAQFPVTDVFSHIEIADGRVGCFRMPWRALRQICPTKSRSSSGPPISRQPRSCSTKNWMAPRGDRSRASSPIAIAPFSPNFNGSSRNVWAPLPST